MFWSKRAANSKYYTENTKGGGRRTVHAPCLSFLSWPPVGKGREAPPPQTINPKETHHSVACLHPAALLPFLSTQALNEALEGLTFTPDENSNALNSDDLASLALTVNDLGLSGEGGAQESEALTIHLIFDAVNDGPLLDLPGSFAAQEDTPLLLSGISMFDTDSDEPGGEALYLGCLIGQ